MKYIPTIGLELHCEMNTKSKVFSSARNEYNEIPNSNIAPLDLAFPGTLPVLNKNALRKAFRMSLALNCTQPDVLVFDRKNYYYPDLPKGYQITQMEKPVGINGFLDVDVDGELKRILIHDIHLEEDTASMDHYDDFSLIDYNRSGVPLVEIVTEPCMHSAKEAVSYLETLRNTFKYCDISQADTKMGQIRCDVNISLMEENKDGNRALKKRSAPCCTICSPAPFELVVLAGDDELLEYREKRPSSEEMPEMDGYTFDRFVVGPSNKFAHAAAIAVARKPRQGSITPFSFTATPASARRTCCSPSASAIHAKNPKAKIVYVKGDDFTNDLVHAIQRRRRRGVCAPNTAARDLLLMDDIQFIAGKQQHAGGVLPHVQHASMKRGKQIVVTVRPAADGDEHAGRPSAHPARRAALMADVQPPDLETRTAIIAQQGRAVRHRCLPDEVVTYIGENSHLKHPPA